MQRQTRFLTFRVRLEEHQSKCSGVIAFAVKGLGFRAYLMRLRRFVPYPSVQDVLRDEFGQMG